MKFLILTIFLPIFAQAHCPIEFQYEAQDYCADINWLESEKRQQGQFVVAEEMSPQLITQGLMPQRWRFSQAEILIWVKGDASHQPQQLPNLRVFPYMMMSNGHHHSTSHDFAWSAQTQSYLLTRMALQEMPGCWSLRWSDQGTPEYAGSAHFASMLPFQNISESDNQYWQEICAELDSDQMSNSSGHHHH